MYSAQHRDGDFMHTGRNSQTKENLKINLREMLNEDYTTLEQILNAFNCVLVQHDEPIGVLEMDCAD
mgnify:CR=1 FL=1